VLKNKNKQNKHFLRR